MNKRLILLPILSMTLMHANVLTKMADEFKKIEKIEKAEALEFARKNKIPVREKLKDGRIIELQKIKNNIPYYNTTHNEDAAISTRTNHLWSSPFSVTGLGYTNLGEWDGGAVLSTHDELTGRVTQVDGATDLSDHATHVAGTLIASGQNTLAKGMAHASTLLAYDWNSAESEMMTAASDGMEVSNHSYGFIRGWDLPDGVTPRWFGDISVSQNEVYYFGFYSSSSQNWDNIAYKEPYYLIVKSAGNDRNDDAPSAGTSHTHGSTETFTDTHFSDGFDNGGYDTISERGIAKNILTVGAVNDVPTYLSSSDVVMSTFSGWGPADDGRIKPDIVGNGVGVYSSGAATDSSYVIKNGTSMASPNVAGTLALLQQSYKLTHSDTPMRSATLKALVIHTADEAGDSAGPDYRFGWGLLNAKKAAETIAEDSANNVIDELSLANNGSYVRNVVLPSDFSSLKVTIVWTDPAGTPVAPALDPTDKMLVNDLNLKITKDGVTYYPWKLDKSNPSNAATNTGVNDVDNVEQVYISPSAEETSVPEGTYTITVDHAGTLASDQNFSIVLSYSQKVQINMAPIISYLLTDTVTASTQVKKTGQTISYADYDDGYYQKGVTLSYSRDDTKQIVTDHITGLEWQDDSEAASVSKPWVTQANYDAGNYNDTSGDTAATYCAELALDGGGWRVPTREELRSIAEYGRYNPAINPAFVNVFEYSHYWSSTTHASLTNTAWGVRFDYGGQSYNGKSYSLNVRCVRAGQ